MNTIKHFLWILLASSFVTFFTYLLFLPIFTTSTLIFPYAIHPFDICSIYPHFWNIFKQIYLFLHFISYSICFHFLITIFKTKKGNPKPKSKSFSPSIPSSLHLFIGYNEKHEKIYLPEHSLYQNILITGSIGSGKTSSAIYPFTKQLLSYGNYNTKLGMLLLDVKGNYYSQVIKEAKQCGRLQDIIVIEPGIGITYNPLDKPLLKPAVLANRLKTILTLFSPQTTESYWLDKIEETLANAITFCRLYNNGYVSFSEIHQLITSPPYYREKCSFLRSRFLSNTLSQEQQFDLLSCLSFFEQEWEQLDSRTHAILQSEITRITHFFVSDYTISQTFSPARDNITFHGFQEVLSQGKIVILHMNLAQYQNLARIIATYLKLDFQSDVLSLLNQSFLSSSRSFAFICDEFQEFCTSTDASFFSQSREAHCINIVSTQSYSSLVCTLQEKSCVEVILQSLVNKLWFRNDDLYTIESAQKQIGKEEKEKTSETISENAKETVFNYVTSSFQSTQSNLTEGFTKYTCMDFSYDTRFFSQSLETFSCLAFLSDGTHIMPIQKISLIPYFKEKGGFPNDD